jgi:hypothetical protein
MMGSAEDYMGVLEAEGIRPSRHSEDGMSMGTATLHGSIRAKGMSEGKTGSPAIADEFAGMREDLERLDSVISDLSQQLSPVLHTRDSESAMLKRGMIQDESASPILNNVMDYRMRIQTAADRLVELRQRLEV